MNFFQRKSPRATFHNYSGGDYFVTICTAEREHYFGEVVNGEMQLNSLGKFTDDYLDSLPSHYPYLEIPLHVVMPNHIHAIFCLNPEVAATLPNAPKRRSLLSIVIGGLKQNVTMYARLNGLDFDWQKRYHDHIIRGVNDGNKISDYIINNPARWGNDCFNQ